MMTKFERRVIAFLLAGLLCIPVTTVPSVSVNAEGSDSTVQQEEDSEFIVQNEETEVQQDGTEEQDKVDTDAEDEQEVSSNEDAGNDLSDGTLIPIEDEQSEDQKANKNKEKQTESLQEKDEQNVTVAQRSARNNLSDEEIEEVTLGEDGEPVRMVTEIPESEESVRYLFQPEESGAYYIDLLGPGWFSVYEETESGYEMFIDGGSSYWAEYGSAVFELKTGITYYIDIRYDYSGTSETSGTVNWKLGRPQEITPGLSYEAVISEPGERVHYHLIYGESEIYYLDIDDSTGAYFQIENGNNTQLTSNDYYIKPNKENEFYIDVFFHGNLSTTGTVEWSVNEIDIQQAEEGEIIHASLGENGQFPAYKFVPQVSGKYAISNDNVSVYDEGLSWVGNGIVNLEEGKTYYFMIQDSWESEIEWSFNESKEIEISTNETIHTEAESEEYYKFIPTESGIYGFSSNDYISASIYDTDWNYISMEDRSQLSAGETYYIVISNTDTVDWSMNLSKEISVQENEIIHTEAGECSHYKFVPETSGRYCFSSIYADVYDSDWNNMWSEGKGIQLSGGEIYYIVISNTLIFDNEYEEWDIKLQEEITVNEGTAVYTEAGGYFRTDYYSFIPEESGKYYISCLDIEVYDVYWSEIDGQRMQEGIWFELSKDEKYYIELTNTSDIRWSINSIKEITIEAGEEVYTKADDNVFYKFIPSETGAYAVFGSDAEIYNSYWNYGYDPIEIMKAGESYYIKVKNDQDVSWSIDKAEETEVELGQVYHVSEGQNNYYKFTSEENAEYSFGRVEVYDSEWNKMGGSQLKMTAGETFYLIPWDNDYYFIVNKNEVTETEPEAEIVEIQSGGTYVTSSDAVIKYVFTPAETGRYKFLSENEAAIDITKDYEWNTIGYNEGFDLLVSLEAGEEYEIEIIDYKNIGSDVSWNVQKIESISAEVNTEYTIDSGNSQEYVYIPDSSGYYLLYSDDYGECKIFDNRWEQVNEDMSASLIYDSKDKPTFGANVYMEAGQPYYIDIYPENEKFTWQLIQGEQDKDYCYWTLADGTVQIFKYTGISETVTIPETIEGKTVTSIGYGAFSENNFIKNVTIPGTVSVIKQGAFYSCTNLQNVTISEESELQAIENRAFRNCEKLENINLPNGIERIGTEAFELCSKLNNINLGLNLTKIGHAAFSGTGLIYVNIPDNVIDFGESVFNGCTSLQEVILGKGLKGIPDVTFSDCTQLTEIELPENITYIGRFAFSGSALQEIDIPDLVVGIETYAFYDCADLKEVNFGSKVTYIEDSAFRDCDLTKITFNDNLKSIGRAVFQDNKNLESIEIPNSVTKIEYWAFKNCVNLRNVTIPDSVESIGSYVFDSDSSGRPNTAWYDSQEDGVVYAGKVLYKYKGQIPEETVITVEEGTKGITENAFEYQYGLKEISLPDTVTNIGEFAFYRCDLMTEIYIPESVTEIGEYALGYLDNAYDIKIPGFTIYGYAGSAAQTYAEENGFTFVEVEPEYTLGDVDASGTVDIADLRMVLRSVCGKATLTTDQKLAADVEKDDVVNIQDLRKILRFVCRKIDSLA